MSERDTDVDTREHSGTARSGLTLVEVILAVLILSVGLTVLLTGASRCLLVMKVARDYQEAEWTLGRGEADYPLVATNTIEDLIVPPVEYDNGCTFSRDVEEDLDEDGLYVVRTRVTWAGRGREAKEEVLSYVYQPSEEE